jgi:uncharacterized protein YkwD
MKPGCRAPLGFFHWLASGAIAIIPFPAQAAPTTAYSHGDPTNYEQYFLEMVNRARLNPAGEAANYGIDLNEGLPAGTLSTAPRPPLALNAELLAAARLHSQWMLDTDTFSHTGDGGSNPKDRMEAAGFSFVPSWNYGENIAWVGSTGMIDLSTAARNNHDNLFVDEGIEGRGHRVNLLNAAFRETGIGVLRGVFSYDGDDYNACMVTEDFGATSAHASSFLVGVVYRDSNGDGFYTPGEGLSGVRVMPATGDYYAITSSSGGYAIPLSASSGAWLVTLSLGGLTAPITKSIELTGQNVKLDFETIQDTPTVGALKLGLPQLGSDGRWTLHVFGTAGQTVALQVSADLKTWQTTQTVTLNAAETDLYESAATPRQFFRLLNQ